MIFSNPADWRRCQNLLLLSTNLLTWPTYRVTVNQYAKYLVILFENYCWLCDKLDCNNNSNIIYLKNHNWPFLLFIVEAWKLRFVSKIFNKSHILNIEILLQESLNVSITWDVLGDVWPAQEMIVKPAVWACVCVCGCSRRNEHKQHDGLAAGRRRGRQGGRVARHNNDWRGTATASERSTTATQLTLIAADRQTTSSTSGAFGLVEARRTAVSRALRSDRPR